MTWLERVRQKNLAPYTSGTDKTAKSVIAEDGDGRKNLQALDWALANQAAEGRPVSNRSKASQGNCTNSGAGAEFTK
jgi:hypothetical protein